MTAPAQRGLVSVHAGLGAGLLLAMALLPIQADTAPWHHEPGYRWRSIKVAPREGPRFLKWSPSTTGIRFTNRLSDVSAEGNRIRENGSGVAAGDVDGDGWCDLYFCRLEGENVLYRNQGNGRFVEDTVDAAIRCPNQYSTGCVLADLDGDGDLDLLVNAIGKGTRCFLNDGTGGFSEKLDSGLLTAGGSMSLALADLDGDGDLDLYVTHYRTTTWKDFPPGVKPTVRRVHGKAIAYPRDRFVARLDSSGKVDITEVGEPDAFYLNDGRAHFRLLSWTGGRFLDEDGHRLKDPPRHWGLSVMFRDFNGDLAPDLWVCNDFLYGADDVWINRGDGRFIRPNRLAFRNSSWSSMAVDMADINRDGWDDIFVVDMLSRDHRRRMTQRGNFETTTQPRPAGAIENRPQFQRNTLFLSRGDATFAEIAQYAGVEASEWSWGVVFLDADLDGFEDLLVATGNRHDLLDGDATLQAIHTMRSAPKGRPRRTLLMYPSLELPNVAFRNRGDNTFQDASARWGFDEIGVSQGICLADLDNDGDPEVVLNNLNRGASVYGNQSAEPRIAVRLEGNRHNPYGIGSRITLRCEQAGKLPRQGQVMIAGGRYLSGDDSLRVFAARNERLTFTIEVAWRTGGRTVLRGLHPNREYVVVQTESTGSKTSVASRNTRAGTRGGADENPCVSETVLPASAPLFEDMSARLDHRHFESRFDDFAVQPLLPRMMSRLGPGVACDDFDGDGRIDVVIGCGIGGALEVYRNLGDWRFERWPRFDPGREVTTPLGWSDAPGSTRLLVSLGNYETGGRIAPAVGVLRFHRGRLEWQERFSPQSAVAGPMVLSDFDGDGDLDLFVGGRWNPARYPEPATSRYYRNEKGRFRLDLEKSRTWYGVGMVSGAVASDYDSDGDADLIMACEWGSIRVWENDDGRFREVSDALGLSGFRGWWNGVTTGDFDGDGRLDLVATNWGENGPYQRYRSHPLRIYYGDVDGNGRLDVIESYFDPTLEKWVPSRDRIALGSAVPVLQGRLPSFRNFADQGVPQLLGPLLARTTSLEANWLETTVFLNRGDHFTVEPLPAEAQWAPAFGVNVADFNGDGLEDLFLAQNDFSTDPETPRYDAGRGLLLAGTGHGHFAVLPGDESGIRVYGEQRGSAVADFDLDGRTDLLVTQNGNQTRLFRNRGGLPGVRIRLVGPAGNPNGIGARIRIQAGNWWGPVRELKCGSGYLSQDSPFQVMSVRQYPAVVHVLWPGGRRSSLQISRPRPGIEIRYPNPSASDGRAGQVKNQKRP